MSKFKTLFGIDESRIKNTCILLPLLRKDVSKGLGINGFSRGKLYSTGENRHFTVIHTGIGPGFSGDAILYLKETRCQNIILFGSCGLVKEEKDLGIGSIVTPEECYSMESFTDMLMGKKVDFKSFFPDTSLLRQFPEAKKVICATLGSLKLEEKLTEEFVQKKIQVVDMECSACFSAAASIKKKALALFYITDIVNKKPFHEKLEHSDNKTLKDSIKSASCLLRDFIEKSLKD